jgi:hypothetical protein
VISDPATFAATSANLCWHSTNKHSRATGGEEKFRFGIHFFDHVSLKRRSSNRCREETLVCVDFA